MNFPACAEALIDKHYGDSHDRLEELADGMNDDGQKDDGEYVPGIPRLRVVDPASIGASSKSSKVVPHNPTRCNSPWLRISPRVGAEVSTKILDDSTRSTDRCITMDSSTRGNSSRPSRKEQTPTEFQRGSISKKRSQNRVAQKSFRDKQRAYLHHLESFVETVKQTHVIHDEDTRYYKLLRSHLELAEENHQLQEALIQVRQKLACIGQSALAVAGMPPSQAMITTRSD